MRCKACNRERPRPNVGDLVQRVWPGGEAGVVRAVSTDGSLVTVAVLGRSHGDVVWSRPNLNIIHGFLHVTERL